MIKFNIAKKIKPKLSINIGATFDIPTGVIVTGKKGESIINGGLSTVTAVVGKGNSFKSTIAHFLMLSAADRIAETIPTALHTYDTEINISQERLNTLARRFKNLSDDIALNQEAEWSITDKTEYAADEWYEELKKSLEAKKNDKKALVEFQCFKEPGTDKPLKQHIPTFIEVDSFSEFEPSSSIDMLKKGIDDSGTNTLFMKQGLFKTKFTAEIPRMSSASNTYFLFTAHVGEKINMATGPAAYAQPSKKLQFLKGDDALKGVSPKFFFLTTSMWYVTNVSVLKNNSTKLPEYPKSGDDSMETDLNLVTIAQLRGKNGPSGYTLKIIVSQTEGVLPTLTEFHYIKSNNRYGISGSLQHYFLDIYPDVKLSRTTVRTKIDNDPKLRRAINITSELAQIFTFKQELVESGLYCTPAELYEDIKKLGYDWDKLLDTRGYWTVKQYDDEIPFLSTIDLLKMRKGEYKPYWYKEKLNEK